MKICRTCEEERPLAEYYLNKGVPMADCKDCHCEKVRHRRKTDPKVQEYDRKRANSPTRRALRRRVVKEWRENNPEAYKAQSAVNNALRNGRLTRPDRCEMCDRERRLHGHHHDYSKPLDVTWLCTPCHKRLHAILDKAS